MERKKIPFITKFEVVEKVNDEFTQCRAYVCALGKNRNFSHISQEAADEAEYSLYNIPVIGHMYKGDDGEMHMGSHDMEIAKGEDGKWKYKSLCVPYGVVPKQDNVHYEEVEEPNGDVKTYLVADCILWTGRYPELNDAVYSKEWMFNQSMEVNVQESAPLEEDKNYTNFLHYTYSALCLLGKSDEKEYQKTPCFPESHVELYELEDVKFIELMEEMRKGLSKVFSEQENGKEGDSKMTPEVRDAILAEYEISLDEIDFEITDEMTEEDFKAKLEEYACKKKKCCSADEGSDAQAKAAFTYMERAQALDAAMPRDENVSYWVCDFDDQYAYVTRCTWNAEAGTCVDEHGRFVYVYDEANRVAAITSEFEPMFVRWLTKAEDDAIAAARAQYEELLAYKAMREQKDKEYAIDEALAPFADLAGNEEFDAIVANKYQYETVEGIQNACYVVRGKFGLVAKPRKADGPSVPVGAPHNDNLSPRDKLHEAYGKR